MGDKTGIRVFLNFSCVLAHNFSGIEALGVLFAKNFMEPSVMSLLRI